MAYVLNLSTLLKMIAIYMFINHLPSICFGVLFCILFRYYITKPTVYTCVAKVDNTQHSTRRNTTSAGYVPRETVLLSLLGNTSMLHAYFYTNNVTVKKTFFIQLGHTFY